MKFCSFTHSIPFSYGLFFRHIKIPAQLPAKHHWSLSACFWTRASTRGGKGRQEGSHVSHTSGTRSCKCLQEAAVGIVCQETNQLPPFYLRSSWCHPSSPHEVGEQFLDQTSRVCGDRQPHPKEPWAALPEGLQDVSTRCLWGQTASGYLLNYATCHSIIPH